MQNKKHFGLAAVKEEGKIPYIYDEFNNKIYCDFHEYPYSDEW
jgi:hypothetical protein